MARERTTPSSRPRDLRAVAIVPARLASTRLARKMVLADTGRPLVVHTLENTLRTGVFARVVAAVDDPELFEAVRAHGGDAVTTRVDHPSGTDRVLEAWRLLEARGERADVVVNVQGDEPELERTDLSRLVAAFADVNVSLATLCAPLDDASTFASTSVVKVVRDRRGDALYFSRAPIPAAGHGAESFAGAQRHVGVYAFTPDALERFAALPRGALEARESLEQLRWLEAGERIRVVEIARAPRGIDTAADYAAFVERARAAERERAGAR